MRPPLKAVCAWPQRIRGNRSSPGWRNISTPRSGINEQPDKCMNENGLSTSTRASKTQIFDYLIVGAGYSGSVLAERLARGSGKHILLVDRRSHIGGNAYDCYDAAGILIHKYGPHIFHTNSKEVFDYLSRFTEWRQYQHKVLAHVDGQFVPIPINLDTINLLYGLNPVSYTHLTL